MRTGRCLNATMQKTQWNGLKEEDVELMESLKPNIQTDDETICSSVFQHLEKGTPITTGVP